MNRGIKTVISFFIFLFSWDYMLEESPPEISSSSEQLRNGLALFFEQKLNVRLLTHSRELEVVSDPRTPLTEYVRYGYSAVMAVIISLFRCESKLRDKLMLVWYIR